MAYTLEEIKELVETLTPIVKNAIEAGSLSVEDLRVAESMDFVNSLPALEEKGLNVSYVKVRLKDLLGKFIRIHIFCRTSIETLILTKSLNDRFF